MLLDSFKSVLTDKSVIRPTARFRTYAITNFRGGIGKSTLAFNIAYEVSRQRKTLLLDVCPQRNFTQSLLGEHLDDQYPVTIYDALLPSVSPGSDPVADIDLLASVPPACPSFGRGGGVYAIPGSKELFLFPSLLYSSLSNTASIGGERAKNAKRTILTSISRLVERLRADNGFDVTLIDTSPFFGGATHLAWVAAEALIIPVRVDQHSIEALRLTLSMLRNPSMDFLRLNREAGIDRIPKVHAIAMTHCGWNRQSENTPDHSTQAYLEQVLTIAEEYRDLFTSENPIDCIHLLDDFHAAGRISGSKRIPLAKLEVNKFHTIEGQRVQVNPSLERYKKELKELAMTI